MTPFLQQVVRHYHPAGSPGRMCFIFPNKRSASFFRKYLGAECAAEGKPMIAPACLTMNDFFRTLDGNGTADRIDQLLILYECYKELKPDAEPLDEFLFWGGILLNDFGEVDKYLVDAGNIFRNVSDFRHIQDSFDYLEPQQKAALEQFLGQFRTEGEYKERFRRIWDLLLPLYRSFRSRLAQKGMASEGMMYRGLADRLDAEAAVDILGKHFPDVEKFVFVGLNALNECEKKLLRKMRDAGVAEFCWDFSSKEIRDTANKSAFFLTQNVSEFPQSFKPDPEGLGRPVVNVVSVPSSVGQVKVVAGILSAAPAEPGAAVASAGSPDSAGIETAIVLPDEGLLLSMLNSIPEEIQDINVTMGYPMKGGSFHALMQDIAAMQQHIREKDGSFSFYHKQVWGIFSNGIFRSILDEAGTRIVTGIRQRAMYYVPQSEFAGHPLLEQIFHPATDPAAYELELTKAIAVLMKARGGMQMELNFAMAWYKAVTRLQELSPAVSRDTWFRLLDQLVAGSAVPFDGEPLKGLQIMGPLETRALDFERLIILSCNEGMFPRRSVGASFIPAELRKGFGLPTYEYQDAVWAYYFYRAIQRASEVWLLYDSRTEGIRSGEESRYIRQLELLYGFDIRRYVTQSPIVSPTEEDSIEKTDEHIARMHEPDFALSATQLQNYLACPAKFFYSKVEGLRPADEVAEAMDGGTIGNVLHETMQKLYSGRRKIDRAYLEGLLKDGRRVEALVREGILSKTHSDEIVGRNLVFEDMICKYVRGILSTDLRLLTNRGLDSFDILGLELRKTMDFGGFHFKGTIDRIDSFDSGTIRVVDYKTGSVGKDELNPDVDKVFGEDNKNRPKIALQLLIYDMLLEGSAIAGDKLVRNCIYQTASLFKEDPAEALRDEEFCSQAKERLKNLLSEIDDKSVPWTRKGDKDTCSYCDFKDLCGR